VCRGAGEPSGEREQRAAGEGVQSDVLESG